MRIPYGYQPENNGFIVFQEKAEVIRIIFDYYLSGASLGKVADMLSEKRFLSPTEKELWTRAAIYKLLSNAKYIPIVGEENYMNVQFEKTEMQYRLRQCRQSQKSYLIPVTGIMIL